MILRKLKKKIEKLKTATTPVSAMIVLVLGIQCPTCGHLIELNASEIIYRTY